MAQDTRRAVHLVGSIPLSNAAEVFETTATILGDRVRRLPDGETGPRKNWVGFQYAMMARHPQFEFAGPPVDPDIMANETADTVDGYHMPTQLRPRPGVAPESIAFTSLGYADAARQSYRDFAALKRAGKIAATARMLVAFPTPMAPVAFFVEPPHIASVMPAYAKALIGEMIQIAAAIPHQELAVQWDVAAEFGVWEGLFPPPPGDWKAMILGQLAELGDAVPKDVELGYHLCYGDRGHHHFIEPKDTANLVEVANGIIARVHRPVQWIHMPVPKNRDDTTYFLPLRDLKLPPGTELYLGLVHHADGIEGTRKRIAAASSVIKDFGVGAECGLGRRAPETIRDLLKFHREAAE
ncbi:MAG: hypothetical protein ACREFD_14180 [Stellaceae bacterium]